MKVRGKPALFISAVLLVLTVLFAFDVGDRCVLTVIALAASVFFYRPSSVD
jgi:hypothetical protein